MHLLLTLGTTLFSRKAASTAIALIFIVLLSGCSHFKSWKHLPKSLSDQETIYVVNHGWHTGIVLPGKHLGPELDFISAEFGPSAYYEFGWGDKGFYEAKEIDSGLAIKAIFWPTDSVMHIVALPKTPENYFLSSEVIALSVSKRGLRFLQKGISQSFKNKSSTRRGLYGVSKFYEGEGSYFMTNTCNTWTAEMLSLTGAPMSSFMTLTSRGVMNQVERAVEKFSCCEIDTTD